MKQSRPACMGTPPVLVGRLLETNGTDEPMQAFYLLPCNNPRRNTSMNYLADDDPRLWGPLDLHKDEKSVRWVALPGGFRCFSCGAALC